MNVFRGEPELGQLVIGQPLPVLRRLDVYLYLYRDVAPAVSTLTVAINVRIGCIES